VKEELSKHVTSALYNPAAPAKISADASAYGLGAVLLQRSESTTVKTEWLFKPQSGYLNCRAMKIKI